MKMILKYLYTVCNLFRLFLEMILMIILPVLCVSQVVKMWSWVFTVTVLLCSVKHAEAQGKMPLV